ncbi:MAG: MOSC domain-containing protein [Jaaginema sp. PMC 1079.18]|nr:MOSC domain-containing protein [Jaaginema sp. PMC 1080.18]MEC4850942.1 MOSC domain-containing protein [Jaaginema sp. PMC 1079.18]MEC4867062.1 MOSC domain-containing protein [Jaaginema sp. PMC 1078.18]
MLVTELWIYPIKSCRGLSLNAAQVSANGLKSGQWGDREMTIVDATGKFITQRQYPQMAQIVVALNGEEITLSSENVEIAPFTFKPTLNGQKRTVEVWRDRVTAIDQGDTVATWLQKALHLSHSVRLMRQTPQHPRLVDPHYAPTGQETVSFADAYPILLTNTASLADLNRRLEVKYQNTSQNVPMSRFRPNIVIEGETPFQESTWETLQINTVQCRFVKPCSRCIVTTTDQITGKQNPQQEPLKTLSTFRQFPHQGILFGENLIPLNEGSMQIGDPISVVSEQKEIPQNQSSEGLPEES